MRKMHEKVKRIAAKAKRGELQPIVATAPAATQAAPTAPSQDALAMLDDPEVLRHLRHAFEFLQTCHLHYCEHCDEEWPVFDLDAWPQGGVAFAGRRAGECETIAKTGWFAAWNTNERCHRCENTNSAYAKMFSRSNGQHLGQRHEGLSALTWYESLLIARVHPVISVVTLTATGLLCYAGHVCNYYVKVLEWFRELPALLRDKKWFMVKRRKSLRAASSGESAQKKPTTANRVRLEVAIAEAKRYLPNVYRGSRDCPEALARFPLVGDAEMLDPEHVVDLSGELRLDHDAYKNWVQKGRDDQEGYPCSFAIWRATMNQLVAELRTDVAAEDAWEFCCRTLSQPIDCKSLGTGDVAQLLLYWFTEGVLTKDRKAQFMNGCSKTSSPEAKLFKRKTIPTVCSRDGYVLRYMQKSKGPNKPGWQNTLTRWWTWILTVILSLDRGSPCLRRPTTWRSP